MKTVNFPYTRISGNIERPTPVIENLETISINCFEVKLLANSALYLYLEGRFVGYYISELYLYNEIWTLNKSSMLYKQLLSVLEKHNFLAPVRAANLFSEIDVIFISDMIARAKK